jgi:RNase P/RNase MRP subunit p30
MAHIVFVYPKNDKISYEDVKRVFSAISNNYCTFNMYCWCINNRSNSKNIRDALQRTRIFERVAVFALTGYWASYGLETQISSWLKSHVEPIDD